MSFGENLQYIRRRDGITQETLAERFGVSRQTVSKWESDGAFPEMDKLILMCEMFGVTMDDMVRGTVANTASEHVPENVGIGKEEYFGHFRRFAGMIAGGVASILTGVALLLILMSSVLPEFASVGVFFLFLILGVALCVAAGISHDSFLKANPTAEFSLSSEEIAASDRRFAWRIVTGIVAILLDVTLLTVVFLAFPEIDTNESSAMIAAGVFMLILAVAVPLIVWAGIVKSSYDTTKLSGVRKEETLADKLSAVIMLTATAVFLILGFVWNLWHPGWVVFPIGGIACGIVEIITDKKN